MVWEEWGRYSLGSSVDSGALPCVSSSYRIVRGVNNLGIESACDWALPKEI